MLLNQPSFTFLGRGEAAQGSTPAAIANAIFDAVGVRLREIPFTPSREKSFAHKSVVLEFKHISNMMVDP